MRLISGFMKIKFLSLIALICAFFAVASAQKNYVRTTEKWRAERENEIKSEDGWFALAGLFWLKEGVNTIGAGDDYDVSLTDNFKKGKFGEIFFQNGTVRLKVETGVEATCEGKNVSEIELVSDEKGKPNVVQVGSQTFYLIKREDRFGIRLKDRESVERKNFSGLKWFAVDKKYRVTAKFEAFDEPKEVLIPNVLGGNFKMKSPGVLKFKLGGREYSLEPVLESGSERLFIIFKDLTSKTETYGAGRFLYAEKAANGKVILDFNRAENPPCAYTSYATCPLPPPQNRLSVEIKAGEKRYTNH